MPKREPLDLVKIAEDIRRNGPSRVMVNRSGEALDPERAKALHGVVAEIVYIREDGWSLGAPIYLKSIAERLWEWEAVIPYGETVPRLLKRDE